MSTEYDLPEAVGHRLRYCGYVCSPYTLSSASTRSANATCATPRTRI